MTGLSVNDIVQQSLPLFQQIAGESKRVKWAEESQFALQAIQRNSSLAKCEPNSIRDSIVNVAAVGLTLNPVDGYAYLVPEYNKATKRNECQLRISFKGLVKAATDTGLIEWVRAEIVREADTFVFNGVDQKPEHHAQPFGERGDPVGVYCIAKLKSGDYMTDTMTWAEAMKIKGCAKTQAVWNQWPEEMAKKAIIKRAQKQWPKSDSSRGLHTVVDHLNETEGSDPLVEVERIAAALLEILQAEPVDLMGLGQVWCECTEDERRVLWTAKTKGGWFTMDEKALIRQAESGYKKAIAATETTE